VIESRQNDRLKRARSLARRRARELSGLFLAEGEDLVAAALAHGQRPVDLFLRAGTALPPSLVALAESATPVRADLLDELASVRQGSDVIGVYRRTDLPADRPGATGPTLALAGLADPGNVGTLVRSAVAFGAREVVLGPGCADPLGPRAVRASMGGIFAVPLRPVDDLARALAGGRVVALDGSAPVSLLDVDLSPPLTIVVGAERAGVPPEVLAGAEVAAIPQSRSVESLNAGSAGTIALWEASRRRQALAPVDPVI
jgi:TrmH family RNA methyltransferase